MSDNKKERNKIISNFHHLCKNLFKYIKRRIIKNYVYPEISSIKSTPLEEESKSWKYFKKDEILTQEDKIYDIFKDNAFLGEIQKCYESLEIIIHTLDENKKNFEYLKKDIEVGEKKIKLLSELNSQLNQYFNSGTELSLNQKNKTEKNGTNNQNIIGHLSLLKSFNILNDLKIINSINDLNTQDNTSSNSNSPSASITNNNIILDNKITNNNQNMQGKKESENQKDNDNNDIGKDAGIMIENRKQVEDQYININKSYNNNNKIEPSNNPKKEFKYLNKKARRDRDKNKNKKKEKYIDIYDNKREINSFSSTNSNNNNKNYIKNNNKKDNKNNESPNEDNKQIKKDEVKKEEKNINSQIENTDVSQNQFIPKENNVNSDFNKSMNDNNESTNFNNNNNYNSIINSKDSSEIEFEKELKREFSCIFSNPKTLESNNDIIQEIKNILKKIPDIKFPENKNKFENPSIIGTHKYFDAMYLLDSLPAIDILFKCKDIKSIEEINEISEDTMVKKLCLSYIEICKGYDKESEIVKVTNKCKIKVKDNYFFIYINLFFVNVNISSYIRKEQCINRYMFSNDIYNNKEKILICLFFRRWRRKFKLFFIVPEFLDIIIDFYYKKNESISLIIENILYDLINGEINFYSNKDKIIDDEKNMNEIVGFIGEWYNIPDHKAALNNAIISTNECLLKNDYLSLVKID